MIQYKNYTNKIHGAYGEMKLLDDRGIFEADDEVGDVFSKIKNVLSFIFEKLGAIFVIFMFVYYYQDCKEYCRFLILNS